MRAWYPPSTPTRLRSRRPATSNLGTSHEQGLDVSQDKLQALNLYRQARGMHEDDLVYEKAANEQIEHAGHGAQLARLGAVRSETGYWLR